MQRMLRTRNVYQDLEDYEKAIEFSQKVIEIWDQYGLEFVWLNEAKDPYKDMAKKHRLSQLHIQQAECYYQLALKDSKRQDLLRAAAKCHRRAGILREEIVPGSRYGQWLKDRVLIIEKGLEIGVYQPSYTKDGKGDIALIYNIEDASASDILECYLSEAYQGFTVVSLDPRDDWDLEYIEKEFIIAFIFGSPKAAGMEKYTSLFQDLKKVIHLVYMDHISELSGRGYGFWEKNKLTGGIGKWFLIAGTDTPATVMAAHYFIDQDEQNAFLQKYLE